MSISIRSDFWQGKRVFVTGHTGFKGSWLSLWLHSMGAEVKGYALEPPTNPSLFELAKVSECLDSQIGDVRDIETLSASVQKFNPDILIHMAAQPLVRYSYANPVETYSVNVMGTVHVLEAARKCSNLRAIVNVTTDKCYENKEWVWGFRENEPLGGHDPYSNSKGCSELVTSSYRNSFFSSPDSALLASARAGNVIGGGDWAQDRLIPDALRAFEKRAPVIIRSPNAMRPWQHVLEPLSGYLILAERLYKGDQDCASAWNFGPRDEDVWPVSKIMDHLAGCWGSGACWEHDDGEQPHEARLLKLDISKAVADLDWTPRWSLNKTLDGIVEWQKGFLSNVNIQKLTLEQISTFQKATKGYS